MNSLTRMPAPKTATGEVLFRSAIARVETARRDA